MTGVPGALAVVGLAALVAVFAVRRAGRLAVAGLLALSGAGIVVAAVLGNSDTSALREKAATRRRSGRQPMCITSRTPAGRGWPRPAACCC